MSHDIQAQIQRALDTLADAKLPTEVWRDVSNVLHACRSMALSGETRLELFRAKTALNEWFEKTAWVQAQMASFPRRSLGQHRADVMRGEIRRLRAHACQHIPGNFTTHRSAWREALTLARDSTTGDQAAYWQHELDAYDRAFTRLLDTPEPSRQAAIDAQMAIVDSHRRVKWIERAKNAVPGIKEAGSVTITADKILVENFTFCSCEDTTFLRAIRNWCVRRLDEEVGALAPLNRREDD